ncbi:DUF2642 domain-containing protein [Peribacillus saganii]|uniref:DUF2642 domain-containing protein n=1 Tax=Peribacillus saganii TaxID=2303992 RepID=A0A372LJN2_9BACI|nr:DUF2642 domain-containing protein [Peribacillus saganii]RFU66188.1 DUF2642 domain-containing protein [Peribacillus saganii]
MTGLKSFLGKDVEVEISGKTYFSGILIDMGLDILVLFNGRKYLYIPLLHLHNIKEREVRGHEEQTEKPTNTMPFQNEKETISYRKILTNAKGQFVEIFVTGNMSIHGYITNVLNDYIVFYSPVFKTLCISMQHLKWLTPYTNNLTPYTLNNADLPVVPANMPLARSFEEQLKKFEGHLLVFDLGHDPNKVGLLKNINNNIAELVNAEGKTIFWKLMHLKTVHNIT